MPTRYLKDSICTSETLAQLSAEGERFWYRLLVQVDDYGRMDGRPAILRARCFPLMLDVVSEAHVLAWLQELEASGLIRLYETEGKLYLEVCTFTRHNQLRAKTSKYPGPNGAHPKQQNGQPPAIDVPPLQMQLSAPASAPISAPPPAPMQMQADAGACIQMHTDADTCPNPPTLAGACIQIQADASGCLQIPSESESESESIDMLKRTEDLNPHAHTRGTGVRFGSSGGLAVDLGGGGGIARDAVSLLAATWEQRMGQTVTPLLLEYFTSALRSHGVYTVCEAIETAAEAQKPRWTYVNGILSRWQREGKGPPGGGGRTPLGTAGTRTGTNGHGRAELVQNDPTALTVTATVIEL